MSELLTKTPPVMAQCYYVGPQPRWVEIPDPMFVDHDGMTGGYGGLLRGPGWILQSRSGWGDWPAPEFRIVVSIGPSPTPEQHWVYAHDLAALMAVLTQWGTVMGTLGGGGVGFAPDTPSPGLTPPQAAG